MTSPSRTADIIKSAVRATTAAPFTDPQTTPPLVPYTIHLRSRSTESCTLSPIQKMPAALHHFVYNSPRTRSHPATEFNPTARSDPFLLPPPMAASPAAENGGGGAARPHIAVLPTPGMGHLIPLAELAKLLVSRHGFTVTFITFAASASKAQDAYLAALPPSITSLSLPPVSLSDLPPDARIETLIAVATVRSLPALRSSLLRLQRSTNLSAFVGDLFAADAFSVAKEIGVPPYLFLPSNFMLTSLILNLPKLDAEEPAVEFRHRRGPLRLPGCVPIPGADLLHPLQDRTNDCYRWMVHMGERYQDAVAILVNTFEEVEPWAKDYFFRSIEPGWPTIYPVGPLIQSGGAAAAAGDAGCLKWLDSQPDGSVIFVSFGSAGTLSAEQTAELALGLEMSGQRFLWVARPPHDGHGAGSYFNSGWTEGEYAYLPEGFVGRTKGSGRLVPGWAPQVEVLRHAATGGFLSHCGWNSTLESLTCGVPMVTWPLFAEQRQNAVMLAEGVAVALRLKAGEDGVYRKEEIARVVRGLMEGEEGRVARRRAAELKAAAAAAVAEGGSSYRAIDEVAHKWKAGV